MMWECRKGCSECCGIVPLSTIIVAANQDKMQVIPTGRHDVKGDFNKTGDVVVFKTADFKCVFLNRETNLCEIYHLRPKLCKEFGTIPQQLCPYIDMRGTPRSEKEVKRVRKYMDKITAEKWNKAVKERVKREALNDNKNKTEEESGKT